jgi:ribose 5-phosphate isomerase B
MRIALATDHAGYEVRPQIIDFLKKAGHEVIDCGSKQPDSVDYPDYGIKAVRAVIEGKADRAVLLCGTGIGMSIVANKFPGIRCAICTDLYAADQARRHNDTNVLALRTRNIDPLINVHILHTWLTTSFNGGRHQRRNEKIARLESMNFKILKGGKREKSKRR